MNLLQLQNGSKNFGARNLFNEASFAINAGEHVGVIGPNGAGKTTLFKIIVGELALDAGTLIKSQQLRVGYLEQEAEWNLEQTSEEYLAEKCRKPIWELKQLGNELGLNEDHFASPLSKLSGGFRMRMKLLYLIGQEPNLMLLDEPTNFLDLESILALEKFLQGYDGAFLLISHDREFLRRTTEATLEVEAGDITKFPGHIDDYFEQKTQLRTVLEAQAANLATKRKHMQEFVDRFKAKASKARQAQSRMKMLDKMEHVEIRDLPVRVKIKIPSPLHTGKESLSLVGAELGYGQNVILKNVNLRLERGVHLGVVGHNGAGKSTLLKSLAGTLSLIKGERNLGYQVTLSHFSQHSADQLDMNDDVFDSLQKAAHKDLKTQDILNVAGSLLFAGDDIKKKIRMLSGGEKSRVALGQVLLKRSPLLLMDEPTNHLDFETVETLTEALRDYEGTVIVVSHDRSFIGRIATKILEISYGRVEVYPGSYDEYIWSLQKGVLKERWPVKQVQNSRNEKDKKVEAQKFNYRDESKRLQVEIKRLQKEIKQCETDLGAQELKRDLFLKDLLTMQGPQAAKISKELGLCSQSISQLEENLLQKMEELDGREKELTELRENV
ncbi:MAG: ABC transporter ATP-binding protein [Proteobacteria bacterium SG_bin7]|nr:MAG: ABC transporter ATP-binding protein [Proteobacteria bacterium SG_bin7]